MSSFDNNTIKTIRYTEREQRKIIDDLRNRNSKTDYKGTRRAVRVLYNVPAMTVSISNPGGNVVNYSVIPRNLSRRGIAFLHGRFIYPESKCNINLPTLDGESMTVTGKIIRCQYLSDTVHEVAALFDSPIDLTLFVDMSPAELEAHHEEYARDIAEGTIEQGSIRLGEILVIDSFQHDLKLCGALLDKIGFRYQAYPDATEAVEKANLGRIDAAIIDVCIEPSYGLQTIELFKQGEFQQPILAISADDNDATRDAAIQAGASAFLGKPLEQTMLENALAKLLRLDLLNGGNVDPIISSLCDDATIKPLLRDFVNNTKELIGTIRSVLDVNDYDHLKLVCRQLKGAGGGFGFEDLSYNAQSVIDTIQAASEDTQAIRQSVDELLDVMSRLRVS